MGESNELFFAACHELRNGRPLATGQFGLGKLDVLVLGELV